VCAIGWPTRGSGHLYDAAAGQERQIAGVSLKTAWECRQQPTTRRSAAGRGRCRSPAVTMAHRRHAPMAKPSARARTPRRASRSAREHIGHALLVDAVRAADDDEDRAAATSAAEDKRFHDLRYLAADGAGGFRRGARTVWQLDDLQARRRPPRHPVRGGRWRSTARLSPDGRAGEGLAGRIVSVIVSSCSVRHSGGL